MSDGSSGARGSLAQTYRRFAKVDARGISPLYEHVALALSESEQGLRAIEMAPARRRHPQIILAALHELALTGRAPHLAAAYAARDVAMAAAEALDTLLRMTDAVIDTVTRHRVRTIETGHHAVLYPAIAEVAHRIGAEKIGLIDVGSSIGLNLYVDHAGITYGSGHSLGDLSSPVRVAATLVGDRAIPTRPLPGICSRIAVGPDLHDLTNDDDVRWLHACLWPEQVDEGARLDAEIGAASGDPPRLFAGDILELLPSAITSVPAGVLPIVLTTWALSRLPLDQRLRFLYCLDDAATERPIAWVSAEGVGVAPAIPTMGDRRASGHSIIGIAGFRHSTLRTEAVGRCWSKGHMLSWLADS